jgi:hypothetical protein
VFFHRTILVQQRFQGSPDISQTAEWITNFDGRGLA